VRIVDVAREAGVSAQTVSNVVNEREGYSEETRQRVLAAIERTGYRPNRAARNLRTRRSGQIGFHLPARHLNVRNSFSVNFLRAVIDAAERAGHQLVVFTHAIDAGTSSAGFVSSGVDGYILCNVDPGDLRPRLLVDAGIPFAVMGRIEPPLPQSWVDIDNAAAMAAVVDRLVGNGHRLFAYVGYDEPEYWNRDRLDGTEKRLAQHGLHIPERWLLKVDLETIRAEVSRRLLGGDRPEAVICGSDSLALVVHSLASQSGLTPGADIAITGFDALPLPIDIDPPLTSVAIPLTAAAEAIVRLVIGQIEGHPPPDHGIVLPTRLAIGGSG
jgi:DNA-binding LacI/PurR family transcriptional regulator